MRAAEDPTRGRGHTNELVRVGAKEHGCDTDCDAASARPPSPASGCALPASGTKSHDTLVKFGESPPIRSSLLIINSFKSYRNNQLVNVSIPDGYFSEHSGWITWKDAGRMTRRMCDADILLTKQRHMGTLPPMS